MTKHRDPETLEYGIAKCLTALRVQVTDITGKSESYIRMCSDPDDERQLLLRDALKLDLAMRAKGEGQPIADAYLALLEEAPSGRVGQCPKIAFLDIASEVGELAREVSEATAAGRVDIHERRAITATGHKLIADVRLLLDVINQNADLTPASPRLKGVA